jgi:hypothetical protein
MRALKRLLARVGNFAMRRSGEQRLREEIEEHLALQIEENIRAGLSPVEARRQAMLKLGSVEVIRESYHMKKACHSSRACCRISATAHAGCSRVLASLLLPALR